MAVNLDRVNDKYLFELTNENGHQVFLDRKYSPDYDVKGVSPMELLLMGVALGLSTMWSNTSLSMSASAICDKALIFLSAILFFSYKNQVNGMLLWAWNLPSHTTLFII